MPRAVRQASSISYCHVMIRGIHRLHRRVAPAFGDRYLSEIMEGDAYFLGAIRYIHMNPVQALQDV